MRRVNRSCGGCSAHENHFRCVWFVLIACGGAESGKLQTTLSCVCACVRNPRHDVNKNGGQNQTPQRFRLQVLHSEGQLRAGSSARDDTTRAAATVHSSESSASPPPPPPERRQTHPAKKNAAKNHTHARQKERERPPRLINVYFVQVLSQSTYRTACTSRLDREYARARRSACANPHLRLLATI